MFTTILRVLLCACGGAIFTNNQGMAECSGCGTIFGPG